MPTHDERPRAIARRAGRVATLVASLLLLAAAPPVLAAVGCDLNDPDRDVARLFPESTGYRTSYVSIDKRGGEPLLRKVERRLGDRFRGVYETIDVPYTIYDIYKGKQRIGYIHGVNQKGQFGGIQVFVVLDLDGKVRSVYIQKMTSRHAQKLRDPQFGRQFAGFSLPDFDAYDPVSGKGSGKVSRLENPAPEAEADYRAVLRALKKNLILMDEFVFSGGTGTP